MAWPSWRQRTGTNSEHRRHGELITCSGQRRPERKLTMIVIRNVFRLKFGKAREAVALFKEGIAIQKRIGAGVDYSTRLLTDVTGPFYTVVLEITVPNLAAFEGE